jgi:hypothetical protein
MRGESCDFVPKTFGGNLGNFRKYLLVNMEVVGKLLVVPLEQNFGGAFHCLGSHSSHCGSKYTNILLKLK